MVQKNTHIWDTIKMYYYMALRILFLMIIGFFSCSQSPQLQDGDKIVSIERNIVTGANGATLTLSNTAEDRTYYLFRHAEKDTVPRSNPVLNTAGYERSYRLADIFRRTKVDKIYSTFYNRTMHTVDSLATTKGIATSVYTPGKMRQTAEEILAADVDKNFVVVGHSNTIPGMVNLLMGEQVLTENIDESIYDDFFIVDIPAGEEPKLWRFKY